MRFSLLLALLAGLFSPAMPLASALAAAAELVPIDGQPQNADLVRIDENWQVGFQTTEGTRQMAASDLVRWGAPEELRRGPVLVLANGGLLVAEVLHADKEKLAAESSLLGQIQVPLERLAGAVFQLPSDRTERERLLDTVAQESADSDQVILTNGDRVKGRFQGLSETNVQLGTSAGPMDLERNRIRALVLNRALARRDSSPARALVGLSDGSLLKVAKLQIADASLALSPAEGLAWRTAREELAYLQPLEGKLDYLSDLKAADYRHVPFLELSWPYRTDRSVTGSWLRVGGRIYPKGLGLHSASRLTWQLAQRYRRLDAQLALDDSCEGQGSVRLRIFVDGVLKYTSPTVRGSATPVLISVELNAARRLDLVIDYADRADVRDRADLLEARLVR